MKIAYIFAYFGDGGAEDHALLLAQSARESGNEVSFIVSSHSKTAMDRLQGTGFEVISLSMESSFNPVSVISAAMKLKSIIKSKHIDIVHAHMLREQSLAVIAKILGGKFTLVRTFHRFDQFNRKMRPLMSIYGRFTDAVIAISDGMVKYLQANGLTNKVVLIKNGVARVDTKKHAQAIGFIGRLTGEKGILKFIQANTELLRKNKLVVAGDGPDMTSITELVDAGKLNVELLGRVSDKAKFYESISVLVLPSETEVLPLVILEAYSCGLPVVAFKLDSLQGLVGTDNGTLVEYPDYAQMGKSALELLAKSESYRDENIAKYESEYSVATMWGQTNELYRNLVKK
ncbi:MAG: glycosyltransferase family 4 protein [Candidatus Saccharibacteria bacterium]